MDYRESMAEFAGKKAAEGRMDENYAVLYQEFLTEPENREQAELIAGKMFTCQVVL